MTDQIARFSVSVDEARRELHFTASGVFDAQSMAALNIEIAKGVNPILAQQRTLRALGDLSDYRIQSREISAEMAETLAAAEAVGIERVAIIMTCANLRDTYRGVTESETVKIFDNRDDALGWLRSN